MGIFLPIKLCSARLRVSYLLYLAIPFASVLAFLASFELPRWSGPGQALVPKRFAACQGWSLAFLLLH
jgi:hypothetical protein